MINVLLFLLGIHLAIQLVAALYGIFDLRYRWSTHYLPVTGKILLWLLVIISINALSDPSQQMAFNAGLAFFLCFHVSIYWVGKLMIHRIAATVSEDLPD